MRVTNIRIYRSIPFQGECCFIGNCYSKLQMIGLMGGFWAYACYILVHGLAIFDALLFVHKGDCISVPLPLLKEDL